MMQKQQVLLCELLVLELRDCFLLLLGLGKKGNTHTPNAEDDCWVEMVMNAKDYCPLSSRKPGEQNKNNKESLASK